MSQYLRIHRCLCISCGVSAVLHTCQLWPGSFFTRLALSLCVALPDILCMVHCNRFPPELLWMFDFINFRPLLVHCALWRGLRLRKQYRIKDRRAVAAYCLCMGVRSPVAALIKASHNQVHSATTHSSARLDPSDLKTHRTFPTGTLPHPPLAHEAAAAASA